MYHPFYCCEPCGTLEPDIIYTAHGDISPVENLTIINQPCLALNQGGRAILLTKISGAGSIIAIVTAIDNYNNIIVAGIHHGDPPSKILPGTTINFHNCDHSIGGELKSSGNHDVFISKYSPNGFVLWIAKIGGLSHNFTLDITIDTKNNIIIVGKYENQINIFDSGGNIIASLPTPKGIGSFIIKYDPSGNPYWVNTIISTSIVVIISVVSDIFNDIYVVGYYSGTSIQNEAAVNFYSTDNIIEGTLPTAIGRDAFIAKYNAVGHVMWTTKIGSASSTISTINILHDIAISPDRSIVVTGLYQTNSLVFFNAPNGNHHSGLTLENNNNNNNGFVAKYNEHGVAEWVTSIPQGVTLVNLPVPVTSAKSIPQGVAKISGLLDDCGVSVAVDNVNDIVITGGYRSQTIPCTDPIGGSQKNKITIYSVSNNPNENFGQNTESLALAISHPDINTFINGSCDINNKTQLINSGKNDNFIIKYNRKGIVLWATRITGLNNGKTQQIITDQYDSIIVIGSFGSNLVSFYNSNDSVGSTIVGTLANNSFVAKYNRFGRILWVAKQTGTNTSTGLAVSVDFNNNIIIAGTYKNNPLVIFNSNGTIAYHMPNNGSLEAFIGVYSDFSQILSLQPSLQSFATKTIILKGYNSTNTLITANANLLVDQNGREAHGIILTGINSKISLIWNNNRWHIISMEHVFIIYR
jgi:hypothetical protein